MGILFSRMFNKLFGNKNEFKILILGLANAGKTTLLYQLNLGQCIATQPTIGCNIEEVKIKNVKIQAWDIGGQESLRSVWPSYFQNTDGVIYMVDASEEREEYQSASKEELFRLIEHPELQRVPILILNNKSDLRQALSQQTICQLYRLTNITSHCYHIQSCSAKDNQGIGVGMEWLIQSMVNAKAI